MARIITYSLRDDNKTSDCYYQAVRDLDEQWTPGATHGVTDIIAGFRAHRQSLGKKGRADEACMFELLALGVMLREHGGEAARLPFWARWALRALIKLPSYARGTEALAKKLRGWMGWFGMRGRNGLRHGGHDVARLLAWLRAHGQDARAQRLEQWRAFLETRDGDVAETIVIRALALADDFERVSRRMLGRFTTGVEFFRADAAAKYRQRYDAELVLRTPLEYHLGMYGTQLLSRINRERFLSTQRRIVIVPPCMRALPDGECKAVATPLGARCQACTPGCQVNQATRLGEKRGFEVYMIPDQLSHISAEGGKSSGGVGMVGVSCALTNWSGGWDADELGVPAQGVLLDYVGCSYHWDDVGIPTALNLRHLAEVVAPAQATGVPEEAREDGDGD
jgi:uncharacterized protein